MLAAEAYGCMRKSCEEQTKTRQTSEWGTDVKIDRGGLAGRNRGREKT